MEPLYVAVERVGAAVRVCAASSCARPQLVRISGSYRTGKTARISDIQPVELRPCKQSPAALVLPPWNAKYWLAIAVFSQGNDGWSRSVPERAGPLLLPQDGLTFVHRGSATGSVVLNLSYP
jgi:hypothetical protein